MNKMLETAKLQNTEPLLNHPPNEPELALLARLPRLLVGHPLNIYL